MKAFETVRNVLLCVHCPGCGELLSPYGPPDFCPDCAREVTGYTEEDFHAGGEIFFKACYEYSGAVEKAILNFKYGGNYDTGLFFARKMAEIIRQQPSLLDSDCIVFVPNTKDGRHRKYNQSEVLARNISRITGIPVAQGVLRKRARTRSQLTCNSESEREINAKKAFKVQNPEPVKNKKVLIIDDVSTSGSTILNIATALKDSGAHTVVACVAGKTRPHRRGKARIFFNPGTVKTIDE